MSIKQPGKKIVLTNVAVVRYRKGGRRFELACYKNKVISWRSGAETDLDEVLQIDRIFLNVSKGKFASRKEMASAFGKNASRDIIINEILTKGDLQVSDKERAVAAESKFKDIATLVSRITVHEATGQQFPISTIERAMKHQLHYSVNPTKSAKRQALDVIRSLIQQNILPIARAKMHVTLTVDGTKEEALRTALTPLLVSGDVSVDRGNWNIIRNEDLSSPMGVQRVGRGEGGGRGEGPVSGSKDGLPPETIRLECSITKKTFGGLTKLAWELGGEIKVGGFRGASSSSSSSSSLPSSSAAGAAAAAAGGGAVSAEEEEALASALLSELHISSSTKKTSGADPGTTIDEDAATKRPKKRKGRRRRRKQKMDSSSSDGQSTLTRDRADEREGEKEQIGREKSTDEEETAVKAKEAEEATTRLPVKFRCRSCPESGFADIGLYKEHMRGRWHRYNLKVKIQGLPAVSEKQFANLGKDAVEKVFTTDL